jgi:hypothetical protein
VYEKGQLFLPHQDAEKDDTMIGTLVVSLPSLHTGGEVLIEHDGKTVVYQASATEVSVPPSTLTAGTRSNRSRTHLNGSGCPCGYLRIIGFYTGFPG